MDVTTPPTSASEKSPDTRDIDRHALERVEPPVVLLGDAGTFHTVVGEGIWNTINEHAHSITDREVGGVLIGETFRDVADRLWLRIDAGIPALAAESRSTNVTFTADAWTRIHELIDRDHPGAKIVGWYHTHPNFGIFLSDMDIFICRHFFDLPHQIAIVIDPVANTHGNFVWRDGVPTQDKLLIASEASPTPRVAQAIDASIARAFAPGVPSYSPPRRFLATLFDSLARFNSAQWVALLALLAVALVLLALAATLLFNSSHSTATTQPTTMPTTLST